MFCNGCYLIHVIDSRRPSPAGSVFEYHRILHDTINPVFGLHRILHDTINPVFGLHRLLHDTFNPVFGLHRLLHSLRILVSNVTGFSKVLHPSDWGTVLRKYKTSIILSCDVFRNKLSLYVCRYRCRLPLLLSVTSSVTMPACHCKVQRCLSPAHCKV